MAQQTRVILRSNISSGQVPPKEIATSGFSSTFGLYDSLKKILGSAIFCSQAELKPCTSCTRF